MPDSRRITMGVSSCLLGEPVRHDGRDKRNPVIVGLLAHYFDFIPCCPEVEIGLGIPRSPIRLVETAAGTRVRAVDCPALDVTDDLAAHARNFAARNPHVSGYIFKRGSPSCGIHEMARIGEDGAHVPAGRGGFAAALMAALPNLPVAEEDSLAIAEHRNAFVESVLVYHRWQQFLSAEPSHSGLIDFHTRHKFSLLAHDEAIYRRLGPLVATACGGEFERAVDHYLQLLMQALCRPASVGGHVNVLLHLLGYFKRSMPAAERTAVLDAIEDYRTGRAGLNRPQALIRRHLDRFPEAYLARQYYLYPGPGEPELPLGSVSGHNEQ